jgi:hypothetical protein
MTQTGPLPEPQDIYQDGRDGDKTNILLLCWDAANALSRLSSKYLCSIPPSAIDSHIAGEYEMILGIS